MVYYKTKQSSGIYDHTTKPCNHAPCHALTKLARHQIPNPTPPDIYGTGLHDTAALEAINLITCTASLSSSDLTIWSSFPDTLVWVSSA